jgi:hypothetical protein
VQFHHPDTQKYITIGERSKNSAGNPRKDAGRHGIVRVVLEQRKRRLR